MSVKDKVKAFLRGRKIDYCHVFNKNDVAVQRVLIDLAKFCRADSTTFHKDARVHAALEGRREVYLRIKDHVDFDLDELILKYGGIKDE